MEQVSPQQIIDFWYSGRVRGQWFSATPELDREILHLYGAAYEQAAAGGYDHWRDDPTGCLALIILLDQFPLNMFRGEARAFASEQKAVDLARYGVDHHYDEQLERERLGFLFMPFMHSEQLSDQDMSVKLYQKYNLQESIRFAEHHRELVSRFGRFPHRNAILGRKSSAEEVLYLASETAFLG